MTPQLLTSADASAESARHRLHGYVTRILHVIAVPLQCRGLVNNQVYFEVEVNGVGLIDGRTGAGNVHAHTCTS